MTKRLGASLAWLGFWLALALLGFWLAGASPAAALTLHATDDANTNLNQPSANFGSSTNVLIRNVAPGGVRHGFLKFDLSPLPGEATISRAVLRFWVNSVSNPGQLDLHAVEGPWNERSLTAGSAPTLSPSIGSIAITTQDQLNFVVVDVTSTVQEWHTGIHTNRGFALVPSAVDPISVQIDSKENTSTSHPPELVIVLAGASGSAGPPGSGGEQGPPGPPGPMGLSVYDAANRRVGTILQLSQSPLGFGLIGTVPLVVLDVDGISVPLRVLRDRFEGNVGGGHLDGLLFSSMDCSGTPYLDMPVDPSELLPNAFVIDPSTVYVQDRSGSPVQLEVGSRIRRDGQCMTSGEGIGGGRIGRTSLPPIDLGSQFTPPFSVR